MARYLSLLRFTDRGVTALKDSPERARQFAKSAKDAGVEVEAQYWTIGSCDGFLVLRADSEEKVLRCLGHLAATGNVRTESLKALDATEFQGLLKDG